MDRRQMTPKGQMSGNGSGPAIAHLPPNMKAMFTADAPLEFKPALTKRKMPPYQGIAQFVDQFETTTPPPRETFEDPLQRQERRRKEKAEENEVKLAAALEAWDPHKQVPATSGEITTDAYKTLFVARISYDTTQHKLRREFEQFGPIKTLRLVQDKDSECRGYAFIEYEKEADMKEAYKRSDGRKIDGRRVVVDVERGRTVRKWKPRRFGGGLGSTRDSKKKGDKPGPALSGRTTTSSSSSSSSSAGHYGNGGGGNGGPPPSSRPSSYGGGGGGGDRYGPSGGGGGGGDRYGPGGGGGGGGGDRYGPNGGGDRYGSGGGGSRRPRSRSRSR